MFAWNIIKTQAEYDRAVAEVERLMDIEKPSRDERRQLELGAHLVAEYEDGKWPVPMPTPVEAIRFRMDQQGLTRKDLEPMIGSPSKVSEVLNGKRSLSLSMVRALHDGLGIDYEILIQDTPRPFSLLRSAAAL